MSCADKTECEYCGEELDHEERESPELDEYGALMCDRCYDKTYRDTCDRCEETVEKTELASNPGELIAIWEPVPSNNGDLSPGYYRVKGWPFFTDCMVGGGWFHEQELTKVSGLDDRGLVVAKNAWCPSGPLCETCRKEIEKQIETEAQS